MIVVLDTNLWLKELALNSGIGSALRFFLKRQKARLALPEVVRLEVQHNLRTLILEAIDNVNTGNRCLLALFGSMKEIVLPSPQEVEAVISGVFSGLQVDVLDVPFSFDSAHASFMKTIHKLPPSDKTQEFKDGVLWADCVRLLDQDDVLLATQDKAFYANREYERGLAKNLSDEVKSKPNRLQITHLIAAVLAHVQTEVRIDKDWFVSAVRARAHSAADGVLSRTGAEVSGKPIVQWELFVTENPDVLYFNYSIKLPCVDLTANGRTDMHLLLTGDGSLKIEPPDIVKVRTGEETLVFTNLDGTEGRLRNIYASANIVIGHRTIIHTIRHRLDDSVG